MQNLVKSRILTQNSLECINYYLAFIFCLILPFNNRYITYLIIPWAIVSIAIAVIRKIRFREVFSLSIYYLIFLAVTVLSLIYTDDLNYGLKKIETMFSLIVMPFLLLVLKKTISKQRVWFLIDSYIAGLLIYIVFSFIVLFIRWDIVDITSYIKTNTITSTSSYLHLSPVLQKSYISMYLVWAIVLILDRLANSKKSGHGLFSIVPLIIFFLFVFALGSRAAMITLLVVIIFYLWKFLNRFSYWIAIPVTVVFLMMLIAGLFKFTRVGETLRALEEDLKNDKRIPQWISAFQIISESPILGYGVGDGLNELVRQHEKNGFEEDVMLRSNAHNQFLETATQTGIFGVTSLLLILLTPLLNSIRRKNELLFLIVSIIFINMMFESLLVRIAGVLFLAYWMNFVSIIQSDPESQEFDNL